MDIIIAKQFHIPLKTKYGLELIESSDIIYFFIEKSKVNVLLIDGQVIKVYHTLSALESYLSELHFYRCHAARLINLGHVKRYNHKTCIVELTNNLSVNVACYRKVEFNKLINSMLPPPNICKSTKGIMNKLRRFNIGITTVTAELTARTMELASKTPELAFLH